MLLEKENSLFIPVSGMPSRPLRPGFKSPPIKPGLRLFSRPIRAIRGAISRTIIKSQARQNLEDPMLIRNLYLKTADFLYKFFNEPKDPTEQLTLPPIYLQGFK